MSTHTACRLSGRDKAAMLLRLLGPHQSAEVLSRLDPAEVAAVSQGFAQLRDLDDADRMRVLAEFARLAAAPSPDPPPSHHRDPEPPAHTAPSRRPAAAGQAVREFDLSKLDRLPRRSVPTTRSLPQHAPERFADLPVRCRAELPAIELPLAMLAGLGVGDVLLLGGDAAPQVEFVGGEGLRLPGRLSIHGERLAVELAGA